MSATRRGWNLAVLALAGCSAKQPAFVAAEVVDLAASVADIDILPDHGYVVRAEPPPRGPHKIIRVELLRPIVCSSLRTDGVAVIAHALDGSAPPPVGIAGVFFDDDPDDRATDGRPARVVSIDLDDEDIIPGARYTFTMDQPTLLFAGDSAPKALAFAFPPFRAGLSDPDVLQPFLFDLAPGPEPRVPGWGVPVSLADLPVMGDPASFVAPTFSFMPPHAELHASFSERLASFALLSSPLDPAIRFVPVGPRPIDVPADHPVPFQELRSRTALGLLPATDYSLTFLSRESANLVPFLFGGQDESGRFLGMFAAPDLRALLGRPWTTRSTRSSVLRRRTCGSSAPSCSDPDRWA